MKKVVVAFLLTIAFTFALINLHLDGQNISVSKVYAETNDEIAKQKFAEGNELSKAKDYEGAISKYDEAIELNPDFAGAYSRRGLAYLDLKNYEQAISDCTHAIELEPNNEEMYDNRGWVYTMMSVSKKENYKLAISDLDKAISLNPDYEPAYFHRHVCYMLNGEEKKSEQDKKKSHELVLKNAKAKQNKKSS